MADIDIQNLSAYTEGNRLEAKKARTDIPNSLWETYSAFANTDGGLILLGVKERQDHTLEISGVDDAYKLQSDFWTTINNHSKVNINILTNKMVRVIETEGKQIIAIEVPHAERTQRPVYLGTDPMRGTYRRDFEGDILCSVDDVAAMFRDASSSSLDQKVLQFVDMSALDIDTIRSYRNRFSLFHDKHIWNAEDNDIFLRRVGAVGYCIEDNAFHPTAAGLLMFGHHYDIVREFPHYFLDYQEKMDNSIRWTHRLASDTGDWSGNVYDFFFKVYPRLTADLPVPFLADGLNRIDETSLHLALREVLLNLCCHADFYGRQGITITKTLSEIKFSNPGNIRIGLKTALAGGISDPRNDTLMTMFRLINIGERAGTGIPDFICTWNKYVKANPVYSESHNPDRTDLVVPCSFKALEEAGKLIANEAKNGTESISNGTEDDNRSAFCGTDDTKNGTDGTEIYRQILKMIESDSTITIDEMSAALNKSVRTVKRYLAAMKEQGLIRRVGGDRNGYWQAI